MNDICTIILLLPRSLDFKIHWTTYLRLIQGSVKGSDSLVNGSFGANGDNEWCQWQWHKSRGGDGGYVSPQ